MKKLNLDGRRGVASLLALVFVIGLTLFAATVSADNGNGKSQGNANGQAKQQSTTTTTAAPSTAPSSNGNASSHQTQGTAGTSGTVTSPQPTSNADQNSGGANGKCPGGPYCSTRNGSPSLNGNGNGQATGKPCAGCVGKADNKNPKGQYPNGSDHNAGYECDRNNGIGKSNPAHTGCKSTPPPCTSNCTPPCTSNCSPPCTHNCTPPCTSNCTPPPTCTSNCAPTTPPVTPPTTTPPNTPVTVTCPKGGGTITVTNSNGTTTTIKCSQGHKVVTPKTPGVVTVSHNGKVVQRIGVSKPSGSQLTG